jgi:hypothetical protein
LGGHAPTRGETERRQLTGSKAGCLQLADHFSYSFGPRMQRVMGWEMGFEPTTFGATV